VIDKLQEDLMKGRRNREDVPTDVRISRRDVISKAGLAGATLAVAGVGVADLAAGTSAAGKFMLPLSLDSHVQFEAFARALGDPALRAALLADTRLPIGPRQLVTMLNDPAFITTTTTVLTRFDDWAHGATDEARLRDHVTDLRSYVTTTYPEALAALTTYAKSAYPHYQIKVEDLKQRIDAIRGGNAPCMQIAPTDRPNPEAEGWFAAWTCVMATVGAVVNAGVYSNVVVAVMVAVALAVAAVAVVV
jgi:hypothetical protein